MHEDQGEFGLLAGGLLLDEGEVGVVTGGEELLALGNQLLGTIEIAFLGAVDGLDVVLSARHQRRR